jgi:hypothetical protein
MRYLTTPDRPQGRMNRTLPPFLRRAQGLALLGGRVLHWRVLPPGRVPGCTASLQRLEGYLGVVNHLIPRGGRALRTDRQALEALEIQAREWVVEGLERAWRIPGIHAFDLGDRLREWTPSQGLWAGFPLQVTLAGDPLKVGGRPEALDRLLLAWMGWVGARAGSPGPLRICVVEGAFENGNPAAELRLDAPGDPWPSEALEEPGEPGLPEGCPEARSLADLLAGLRGTGGLEASPEGGPRLVVRLPLAPQFHP